MPYIPIALITTLNIYIGRVEGVEDFSSAYYFIFITWSTIGFGDYATEGAFFYVIAVMGLVLFAALMSALGMYV